MRVALFIGCRSCDSPDCNGCNLKRLETMLGNGKFDCLMNENRSINTSYDIAPVVRCEDCMFWKSGKNECESWEWCMTLNLDMPPHAFCNLGVRKDDDDD